MITIDGSEGEGGGQILRTSLSLGLLTGQPFRIEKIRAGRKKPGLLRQHLAAVRAAAEIGADVEGDALGSTAIVVRPKAIRPGEYRFKVGTAGSTSLVLQTVLPPLLFADGPSRVFVEGGTHNPFAPPFDFLERVFFEQLRRMGPKIEGHLRRIGYYPAGGGEIEVGIEPVAKLEGLSLETRGAITHRTAIALFAGLPAEVAKRELEVVRQRLGIDAPWARLMEDRRSRGPGNVLLLEVQFPEGRELVTGFGERGVRAEKVAGQAIAELERFVAAEVPVGVRLADQLMIPFALAGDSMMRTLPLSQHARTNLEVIGRFLDARVEVDEGETTAEIRFRR